MSKSLRLSEKWFRRGLWLVALVFAGFLIGLGNTVVGDLPKVENALSVDQFMDPASTQRLRLAVRDAQHMAQTARDALEQAQLKQRAAQADSQAARDSFNSWLATRHVTARADQDPDLIKRTAALETLRSTERDALAQVEAQQQKVLDANQAERHASTELQNLESTAQTQWQRSLRAQELRVFCTAWP